MESKKIDLDLACNFTISSFAPSIFLDEWEGWNEVKQEINTNSVSQNQESLQNHAMSTHLNLDGSINFSQCGVKETNWNNEEDEESIHIKRTIEELTSEDPYSHSASSPERVNNSPLQNKDESNFSQSFQNLIYSQLAQKSQKSNSKIEEENASSEEEIDKGKKKTDKQRRERNNILERKRRDNINTRIMEVYQLLPDRDFDQKPNKSVILCKCINYLKYMQITQTKMKEQLTISSHHTVYLTNELSEANKKIQQLMNENAKLKAIGNTPQKEVLRPENKRRRTDSGDPQFPLFAPSPTMTADLGRFTLAICFLWFTVVSPIFTKEENHERRVLNEYRDSFSSVFSWYPALIWVFKTFFGLISCMLIVSWDISVSEKGLEEAKECMKKATQRFKNGEYESSLSYLVLGLKELKRPLPNSKLALYIAIIRELLKKFYIGFVPSKAYPILFMNRANSKECLIQAAQVYNLYNESFMGNTKMSPLLVCYVTLCSVNIAEVVNDVNLRVLTYGYLARNALIYKDRLVSGNWISRYFLKNALKVAKQMRNESDVASLIKIDGFHLSNCGNQQAACENFVKAAELYRSAGSESKWRECMTYQAWIKFASGQMDSFETFKAILSSAEVENNHLSKWRAYIGLCANTLRHGYYTFAEDFTEMSSQMKEIDYTEKMAFYNSFKAGICLRNGKIEESVDYSKKSISMFKSFDVSVYSNEVVALSFSVECIFAYLRKIHPSDQKDLQDHLLDLAQEGLELMKKFGAKDIGFYRSRYYVYLGVMKHLSDQSGNSTSLTEDASSSLLETALMESQRSRFAFEEAVALLEMARCSSSPSLRSANLRKASEMFETCKTPFEVSECYQELQVNCISSDPQNPLSFN